MLNKTMLDVESIPIVGRILELLERVFQKKKAYLLLYTHNSLVYVVNLMGS